MSIEREPESGRTAADSAAGSPSAADEAFERRASELLVESAERLDGRTRSRLTQARHAALAELQERRSSSFRVPGFWLPVGSVAAATVLALAVWFRAPSHETALVAASGEVSPVEDIAILASADGPELYAEEADFYEWAGEAVNGAFDQRGG